MRTTVAVLALCAALTVPGIAWSQDAQVETPPPASRPQEPATPARTAEDDVTELSAVTVVGGRTANVVASFVEDISAVQESNGQVARFDIRVCAGVAGLSPAASQAIIDRIARATLIAGLQVGRPGCTPNVLVIATDDSDRLAAGLLETNPRQFAYQVDFQERGLELIQEFSRPGRVVRWWHLTELDQFGHSLGSRLRAAYETDIFGAIIIVDTKRTGPVTLNALGDYVALAALARLSPDADLAGLNTVLNLFELEPASRPASMTAWDEAYLQAVYSARPDAIQSRFQFRDIADRMLRRYNRAVQTPPGPETAPAE